MGNKLARTTQASASEYYLHDLPSSYNLVLKEVLGGGRFLKSVQCVHDEGLLLVKVYFKRGESLDLKEYERKLRDIRDRLRNIEHSHVWPFQHWIETDKAAYLLRQYFFSNLHDRISTRPFLSLIEKKWLAFQLLHALKQSHERGVCHGDIKCENVLVTSWNWVYLADYYGALKPTFLPADNPADFSFFFDTGSRRRCYLAPERFHEPNVDMLATSDAPLTPAMDIFSLGCVIGEMFLEGKALFDLSQLLAYRQGKFDPRSSLEKIPDEGVRAMILDMINVLPEKRLSADQYLKLWCPIVFPEYFSPLLHDFFSYLVPLDTDNRVALTQSFFPEIRKQMQIDSRRRQFAEANGDGIADLVLGTRRLNLSPTQKQKNLYDGDFIVNEPFILESARLLSEGQTRSVTLCASSHRIKAAAVAMTEAASALEEVVTEEVLENQVREPGGTFYERLLHTVEASMATHGIPGRCKDDVTLPLEGGWRWDGDWEVDPSWVHSGVGADEEGWRYRKVSTGGDEGEVDTSVKNAGDVTIKGNSVGDCTLKRTPPVSRSWTSTCTPDCVWRQRKWIRKRRRRPCHLDLISQQSIGSESQGQGLLPEASKIPESGNEGTHDQTQQCEGMVLIAALLCACLRNVKLPQARRGTIQLLKEASSYIEDDARLQHVIPYVVALLSDNAAIVRCTALQTLCDVLSLVQVFPPSDAKMFPEYILPLLSMLPDDSEESVRIAYAANIHKIAETANRFMMHSQEIHEIGSLDSPINRAKGSLSERKATSTKLGSAGRLEGELAHLRETIARVIQELVMGQKQTPTIRRALLQNVGPLCRFFGPKHSNDFLLPILPAFLNDRDEQLRAVFFEHIVHVCLFVGRMSLEAYLLPYLEQALNDVEETVIVNALECLAALCTHRLLRKRVLLEAIERASPLLCHPSQWVRRAAISFVAASSANLEPTDSYAFLSPILLPFLRREPASLCSEVSLLACLKPPVSREVFNRVLSDVMLLQTEREKAAANKQGIQRTQSRRVAPILPPPEFAGVSGMNAARESKKSERESRSSRVGVSQGPPRNNAKRAPMSGSGPQLLQKPLTGEGEDGEKMKAMEGYLRNLSSTMQTRMLYNWEADNTEKLQSSAIGFAAGVGAGFYSNYDGSSEGIPLYFVPVNEKKPDPTLSGQGGTPQVGEVNPSFNEEWSRVFGGRQGSAPFLMATIAGTPISASLGPASSQWANVAGHSSMSSIEPSLHRSHVAMTGSSAARMLAGSVYQGPSPISYRKFETLRGSSRQESGEGLLATGFGSSIHSMTNSKASLASSSELLGGGKPSESNSVNAPTSEASLESGTPLLSSSVVAESSWKPRGVLIAHLQEHQRAVNEVAVSSDNVFLASASDDGTVKIWDCRRLERDISFRSRLTYPLQNDGRALHVSILGGGHQVAAASSEGNIHVFTVDYVARQGNSTERYTGISDTRKLDTQEGNAMTMQSLFNEGPSQLLYSTQRNGIHLWDLRTQTDAWVLRSKPDQGYITAVSVDPACNWLVSATSRGVLTLWDLRFQIAVNTWQHPACCPVESMCVLVPGKDTVAATSQHPYVWVAAGRNEVALWNAADGICHRVLRLCADPVHPEMNTVPAALSQPLSSSQSLRDTKLVGGVKFTDYRMEELNEPPPRLPGVRALLPLSGGAALLTGGSDCRIRMWDRLRPDRSYHVCGPTMGKSSAVQTYELRSLNSVRIVQETPGTESATRPPSKNSAKTALAAAATDNAGCHRDCILSLASAQTNQRLLISSSRDGAIKVWK
ncbi:serine/threonine-protein kinase VPS15 isoform X3 [Physcomitrium patens]|uniref:serine/threonine-protein kinase VPS15 isoform X3 n=1 Tax=Physcomitrium patens TaxID=3218 RepID=UPI000D1605CA|nr:serine/threonine-protein kinase VPS15-like isoform X3 [Physcomitrium patens]|eukprot:XP_024383874.1 serine/threonine-protein kinase VPS15-like isoform X3 [Physcomitrella patens]